METPLQDSKYIPPVCTTFVGRESEIQHAEQFLLDQRYSAKTILLVHGQRGIGKTAFVWKIANLIKTDDRFKHFHGLLWLDRSNLLDLLGDLSENDFSQRPVLPPRDEDFQDDGQLVDYVEGLAQRKQENNKIGTPWPKWFADFLKNEPFVLIIDDFDEEITLANMPEVSHKISQLAQNPNKVMITARIPGHAFSSVRVERMELGLLSKRDVLQLTLLSALSRLDEYVLLDKSVEKSAEYIWEKTYGLAELLNRYLLPKIEQEQPLLDRDPVILSWLDVFAQAYLLTREQPTNLNDYEDDKTLLRQLDVILDGIDSFSKSVLWSWTYSETKSSAFEGELGQKLGYFVDDPVVGAHFHRALLDLYKHRLIARFIEYLPEDPVGGNRYSRRVTWIYLPAISNYLKKQWPKGQECWLDELDNLMTFVDGYLPFSVKVIMARLDRLHAVFLWCHENKQWQNVISLGGSISGLIDRSLDQMPDDESGSFSTDIRNQFIEIVEKTAEVMQDTQADDWKSLVREWILLARLFSKEVEKAKEYALKAYRLCPAANQPEWSRAATLLARAYINSADFDLASSTLSEIQESGTADNIWASVAYLLASLYQAAGKYDMAYSWYCRVFSALSVHQSVSLALNSCIQIAQISDELPSLHAETLSILERGSALVHEPDIAKSFPDLSAGVLCWYAVCFETQGDPKRLRSLLKEAGDICKSYSPESPLHDAINNRLIFMEESDKKSFHDSLSSNNWFFSIHKDAERSNLGSCPICRNSLENNYKATVKCSSCGTVYHLDCLGLFANRCVVCRSTILS